MTDSTIKMNVAIWKPKKEYLINIYYVKSIRIRKIFVPHYPLFGLNMDQKNSEYAHLLQGDIYENECCQVEYTVLEING